MTTRLLTRIEISFWSIIIAILNDSRAFKKALLVSSAISATLILVSLFPAIRSLSQAAFSFKTLGFAANFIAAPVAAEPEHQRNLLIVTVDSLDHSNPTLMGIWLVANITPSAQYTFIPLYPAALASGPVQDDLLKRVFRLTTNRRPDPAFLRALKALEIRWDNFVVMDEIALAELIDLNGGVTFNGTHSNGVHSVARLTTPWDDASQTKYSQAELAGALCIAASQTTGISNPDRFLTAIQPHLVSDLSPRQFALELNRISGQIADLRCEFPTLQSARLDKSSN
jgi:hypothetical protein